jgi:hypothetical protein
MKEFVYDFGEFKKKVSTAGPIHHSCMGRYIDKEGIVYGLTFRVYGVSREGGHIIVFETRRRLDTLSKEFNEKWPKGNLYGQLNAAIETLLDELKKAYAAPVGSTEGRLEL